MTAHIIGYARVSTNEQDLTAQRNGLATLGMPEDLIYGVRHNGGIDRVHGYRGAGGPIDIQSG